MPGPRRSPAARLRVVRLAGAVLCSAAGVWPAAAALLDPPPSVPSSSAPVPAAAPALPSPADPASLPPAPEPGAPAVAPAELAALARRAAAELDGNILPFWLQHTRDPVRGGFFGVVNEDLSVRAEAPRGALLTARILWTFSAAYRRSGDAAQLAMARWACEDLLTRHWDAEHGGLFWTVTAAGQPLDTRKQIYGQVFGIYGLAEFYRATQEPAALERAIALYRLVERHGREPVHGGYVEACDRAWRRHGPAERSVMGARGPKSQNTHLHVMEAFTALLRVWPDAGLQRSQHALITLMLDRILDERTWHLHLFLADDWTPLSREFSPGHDLEAAWLLTEAAAVLGDAGLIARTRRVALEISRATLAQADTDGALFNLVDARGIVDSDKDWWPQAEAAVGFLDAYQLSGDRRFFDAAVRSWDFIERHLVDRQHGEWFESVSRHGEPRPHPKASHWKCPYHNGRACLELIERLQQLRGN